MYVRKGKNLPLPEIPQYDFSGFNFSRSDTTEITLTGSPAVENAMFRVIRSTDDQTNMPPVARAAAKSSDVDDQTLDMLYNLHQIPLVHEDAQMQVFGYVLVPWVEDWYGDIFDPRGVESACHSFMKSVSSGTADGPGGVGENHWRWMANGYPIQSVVDYSGSIGGIPGGWWVGLQISNPETWNLIKDGTYKGFSIGCYVNGTNYNREEKAKSAIWDKVTTSFANRKASQPAEKATKFQFPGLFGFPKEDSLYADPVNRMFPIDTGGRALAVTHYLLDVGKSASYTDSEVRFMVGRAVSAAQEYGMAIPDKVVDRLGLPKNKSANKSVPTAENTSATASPASTDGVEAKESSLVTKAVDAVVSALKSVFVDKEVKNSEATEEVLIDMDKKELLGFLASDEARTALLGDLPETLTKLSSTIESVAQVAAASASLTADTVVTKSSEEAQAKKEPTEEATPVVTPAEPTLSATPAAPLPPAQNMDPLGLLTALEKMPAMIADTVAQAVAKAMEPKAAVEEAKKLSTEDKITALSNAIDKLDKSMAERGSVSGTVSTAIELENIRKQREQEAYQKAHPFDGSGAIFDVSLRRATVMQRGQVGMDPVEDEPKEVAKSAPVEGPLPVKQIHPEAHPAFSA